MSRAGLTQTSRDAIERAIAPPDAAVARVELKAPAKATRRRRRGRTRLGGFLGILPLKWRFAASGFFVGCAFAAWFAVEEVERRVREHDERERRRRELARRKAKELREVNKLNSVPIIEEIEDEYDSGNPANAGGDDFGTKADEYKMVLLIRTDLPMGAGKVAAQAGHASVGAVLQLAKNPALLGRWGADGQKKVALGVKSLRRMDELAEAARAHRLNVFEVVDAGRTEVDPGTKTVVAIGPAAAPDIDSITGELRLY